jgi:hypothetical protein
MFTAVCCGGDQTMSRGFGEVPTLAIDSEQFWKWAHNHERMQQLFQNSSHKCNAYMYLRGSRHSNFSDIPKFSPVHSTSLRFNLTLLLRADSIDSMFVCSGCLVFCVLWV